MKRSIILICVVAFPIFFTGIQHSYAVLKEARPDPAVEPAAAAKIGLPDLTVSIKFSRILNPKRDDGRQCYYLRSSFTITNIGQSEANNFDYKSYWNPGGTWQDFSSSDGLSLKPGQSMTRDFDSSSLELVWCTFMTDWRPGWRVVVDTTNNVAESNENNNMAEKIFEMHMINKPDIPKPPQHMIKPDIPKATQKEIQPAPMPKRPPIKAK